MGIEGDILQKPVTVLFNTKMWPEVCFISVFFIESAIIFYITDADFTHNGEMQAELYRCC